MIRCENLSIGYGRREVQHALTMEFPSARLIALVGPNGSGKSTLMRTICGLQPALAGQVFLDGRPLPEFRPEQRARRFSLVLTGNVDIDYCTVEQLVSTGRSPHTGRFGHLEASDREAVARALQAVHLESFSQRPLRELSDGERQRALIAKALAQDTDYIMLDEPTAHLDLPNRIEVMTLLRRLAHEEGKGVLLLTHELELALKLSDTLWLLRPDGGGLLSGTPAELLASDLLNQTFSNGYFSLDGEGRVTLNRQ